MSVISDPKAARLGIAGVKVQKAYPTLAVETKTLFTVSGLCLITNLVARVTTAISTDGTSVKLQADPTTGTNSDLCAATDLGTSDTPAGNLVAWSGSPAEGLITGIGAVAKFPTTEPQSSASTAVQTGGVEGVYIDSGVINQVTASAANGGLLWFLTYVPIEDGATIVAA